MTRHAFRSVALALGLMLIAAAGQAQSLSSGTIAGVVKDESGAVLPGVIVEAASPALIERVRTAVTDDSGVFRIVDLRPASIRSRSRCQASARSGAKAWS